MVKRNIKGVSMNVKHHTPQLFLLVKCDAKQRAGIINPASGALIRAICECVKNSLAGKIPHTEREKIILKKHKSIIKELVNKKISQNRKKRILSQKGAGAFLPMILGPVVSGLVGVAKQIFGL